MVIRVGLIESRLTYEHLRQMPDDGRRYELLGGDLVVSLAPSTKHQKVVRNIGQVLLQAQASGAGEVLWAPTDVVLDPQVDAVQPDLLFVVAERRSIIADDQVRGVPDLLVEVLSDNTAERDLGVKLRVYARYGVRFYWVADPGAETLRVFELQPGGYRERPPLRGDAVLECPLFPGVTPPVATLFAG